MHKVYCVIGRSAVGKTTLTREVAKRLGKKVIKSYTTRPMRPKDTAETSDHIHIQPEEVEQYRDSMIAYTEINGAEYFATEQQLLECDFYVIDPVGFYDLLETIADRGLNVRLVAIYITAPKDITKRRADKRNGDSKEFATRSQSESDRFSTFVQSNFIDYYVRNSGSFEDGVQRFLQVIAKDSEKEIGRNK